MKVAAITGKLQGGVVERPDPVIRGEFVKVKLLAAPMCTEFHAYREGHSTDCLGHEAAGEVVEVAQLGSVALGDRVVVMPQYACGKCWPLKAIRTGRPWRNRWAIGAVDAGS